MTIAGRTGAREPIDEHLPGDAAARRLPAGELRARGRGRCARQSLRGLVRHAARRPRDAFAERLPAGRRLGRRAARAGGPARGAGRRPRGARQSRNHPARGRPPARVLLLQAAPARAYGRIRRQVVPVLGCADAESHGRGADPPRHAAGRRASPRLPRTRA